MVNPHEYYTPDVIADFSNVQLKEVDKDKVQVTGGTGRACPSTLKVSVGYLAFYLGEGEISYAGTNALARAKLAGTIVQDRLSPEFSDLRVDYIGLNSIHRTTFNAVPEPYEVRLRVAGKAASPEKAALVGEEVEALSTNGPAGGGGVRKHVNEIVGIVSVLLPREKVNAQST